MSKLIRNWSNSAGVRPGAIARCGQLFFGNVVMAMVGWLSSIAFSYFRREITKGGVIPQSMNRLGSLCTGISLFVSALLFVPSVFAATGGGTIIHNAVTVSSSLGTVTASVDVTVNTLAVTPQISVDTTAQTVVMTSTATYSYTLVNNSNGADTFSVTAASVDAGMVGAPGLNVNATATPSSNFTLGASITSAASDALGNIYIPANSETSLIVGDEIVVSGIGRYTIASLTPGTPASTTGAVTTAEVPTQMTLTPIGAAPAIGAGTVAAGTQLGEQAVFPVVVTANTLTVPTVDGAHTVNLSGSTAGTDAGGVVVNFATSAGSLNENITTVTSASGTLLKEVRNVTSGTVFASSGGTLESGDTLEYRITATPTPGGGDLLNSLVVDEVPTNTVFVSGSTRLNGVVVPDGVGATLPTTATNGGLQINSPTGAAGVLVDGESAVLIFQVTVGSPAPGDVITNTANLTFTGGSANANATATAMIRTVSTIELLQYAPGPVPGSSSIAVPATSYSTTGLTTGPFVPSSNPVAIDGTPIPMPGTVELLAANNYKASEPVFVRLTDADQNSNPLVADNVLVTVTTPVTGDSVVLQLTETGINTGVFIGYVQTSSVAATINDDVISVGINELLNVAYVDVSDGTDISAVAVLVDPYGVVFSTSDGSPLDGATVTLWNVGTNLPATVFADDGVTPYPATVTSGDAAFSFPPGGYRFPLIAPGTYRLDITPPAGYSGPSTVPTATIQALPGAPFFIVTGSRNENFVVNPGPALHIDIPLDASTSDLFISKQSMKSSVSIGEYLQYQLDVSSTSPVALAGTSVVDVLPIGFRYEPGSARIDGAMVADPAISSDGRTLTFAVGAIAASSSIDLRYVVAVTAGAREGDAINLASGTANGGIISNTAQAVVKVVDEMMPSRSHLMGRVIAGACNASDSVEGVVSLQLQSKSIRDVIDFEASINVDSVSVSNLSIVVNLPGSLEYVSGSALRNDVHLIDPIVKGGQLIFKLGEGQKDSSSAISFRVRTDPNALGEYSIRAYAEFEDPSDMKVQQKVLQRTPTVVNKMKDFSRILRPRFDSLSAELKADDLKELDELALSLRGQDIRSIHIIGHTDKQPIRARSRSIFANNEALSHARAKSVGVHLQKALGLKDSQIQISGMGSKKQLYYSERLSSGGVAGGQQLLLNRRVEVLVELEDQSSQSRFIITHNDSGVKTIETAGPGGELSEPDLASDMPGVEGVRLILEDGRYVDTDEKGLYHFEGLKPGTHVVQVDTASIPDHMEIYSCEKNTRFSGTPHSQFVDMQGGTLWRADFYLRNKSVIALKGNVGLQLTSDLSGRDLLYKATMKGQGVVLTERRLVVDLPYGTQYVRGSALLDGKSIEGATDKEGQLVFGFGDSGVVDWEHLLSFTVEQTELSEGEFTTMATLMFETVDGKLHQSSMVENELVRQTGSKRDMVYLANYRGVETELSAEQQQRLEGVIDYLRGKKIRQIEVIAHADDLQITERRRSKYLNYKALSQARVDFIGSYIADSLGLFGQQVKRIVMEPKQAVENRDRKEGRQANRRVEIFVTLADEDAPYTIKINRGDSGQQISSVVSTTPSLVQASDSELNDKMTENPLNDGVLNVREGQRIATPVIALRLQLDSRLKAELRVDGVLVPNEKIGFKKKDASTGKTIYTYIGVDLGEPGSHKLTLKGMGPFGNARVDQTINYVRTSEIAAIRVVKTDGNVADGKAPVKIRVQLLDKNGDVINAGVNLKLKDSELRPYRFDNKLPGLRRDNGSVEVTSGGEILFEPVSDSGIRVGKLSYNNIAIDFKTYIKPVYRDWIMVGVAEGTLAHDNLSGNMQNIEAAGIEDKYYKDGRLAFYAKGTVQGKYLITTSFDSAKEKPETGNGLFGTIDPNKYYTLYGDGTTVRYDAQSAEKLYIKIESDNFYTMFGDYNTGLTVTDLGRYSRSMTGLKAEYRDEKITVTAFASETRQAFVKDEIRGEGTSGLYRLSRQNIVLNSEKITIEVRDRFRSEVVLESRQLSRYVDYTFDPVDGTVYFREPIYSRDENFNPVYIVANYEVNSGGGQAITAGGRIAIKPSESAPEFGATLINEGTPGAEASLLAADVKYDLDDKTTIKAEVATTNQETGGSNTKGTAYVAEVVTRDEKIDGKAYIRRQEGDYGLGQQMGSETATQKIGADGKYRLSENTTVNAELYRQENLATDAMRDVVSGNVELKQEVYTLSGGARYANDKDGAGNTHQSTVLTGSAKRSLMKNRLDVHANAELAVGSNENAAYPNRLIAGGEYKLTTRTQLFVEQEVTYGENQDSNTTRAGLKATPWKNATLSSSVEEQRSEYGPRVFSNMGLTQGVEVNQFLRFDFGIERVKTLRHPGDAPFNVNVPPASGTVSDDFTAVTAGASYKKERWSLTSRAEWRDGEQEDKLGLLLGFYREQSPGFGLAATLQHFDTERVTGNNNSQTNLEFSIAYRPIESQWIILNRSRYAGESAHTIIGTTRTKKLINNLSANYLYDRNNQISLMHGIKYVVDNFDGAEYSGMTNLLGVEYRHDINHRWDVGAQASMLTSDVGNSNRYSWGVSVGHSLVKNLWISVGINIDGFSDEDFSSANYTASGVYAKFRFAFDHYTARKTMAWWEKD